MPAHRPHSLPRPTLALLLALPLLAAGCDAPPDLRGQASPAARAAPYPDLIPIDALLAEAARGRLDAAEVARFEAEIGRLQRKADILRRQMVLTRAERDRLRQRAARLQPASIEAARVDARIDALRRRADDLRRQMLMNDEERARLRAAIERAGQA
ncbi:hypothetical protein BV394_03365 [Brevirhabdus pacifica]|uniref:Uncharacterized protein n=1 Tax=Brevirhabdus pacifica TaxID=1267768 RepID=A0A1U7DFZ7_9RHOB|nr:hypothetical protein [Brevirhabdus pacifica]APX88886.1 hypothetical protein BV394_03365 [Brevirhabdus pacifica]PJJ86570.1 hypothetical protein CLV77_1120 [Brevirhabdus pacifica]